MVVHGALLSTELIHRVDVKLHGVHMRGQLEAGGGQQAAKPLDGAVVEDGAAGEQ
jgi:hypothetical protein